MGKEELILDFTDHDGKRYIFSKDNFDKHKKKHPELGQEGYLEDIKRHVCTCHPSMIYPCYSSTNRYAYYEYVHLINGCKPLYHLVIIKKEKWKYHIITAYQYAGEIREKRYTTSVTKRP